MNIEIRELNKNSIIVKGDYKSIKHCLESLKEVNFKYADIKYQTLDNANLSYMKFPVASFRGSSLVNVDFTESILWDSNFIDTNLKQVYLQHSQINGANFCNSYMNLANLHSVYANNTNFTSANLSYADLSCGNFRDSIFKNAIITGVNFERADMSYAVLEGAIYDDYTLTENSTIITINGFRFPIVCIDHIILIGSYRFILDDLFMDRAKTLAYDEAVLRVWEDFKSTMLNLLRS